MKPCNKIFVLAILLVALSSEGRDEFHEAKAVETIDRLLSEKLVKEGLRPNPKVTDDVFVRRAYLALIGRIPTVAELHAFLRLPEKDRDSVLIDQLLANDDGYTAHHYQFWADLLRISSSNHWSLEYSLWVQKQIEENTPYDDFVRSLVTGHGLVFDNPAAGYYIRDTGMPLDNMSNTVRIFLGTRLECAQCHDHPFDKWTQKDYFGMAAFTYGFDHRGGNPHRSGVHNALKEEERRAYFEAVGIERVSYFQEEEQMEQFLAKTGSRKFLEENNLTETEFRTRIQRGIEARTALEKENTAVYDSIGPLYNLTTYLEVRHLPDTDLHLPHDYQYDDAEPNDLVLPATMFGEEVPHQSDPAARKKAYADWLTDPGNPRFTRVIVNRLWKRAFGVGLFEPVDDLTDYTKISQPELLEFLETLMRELDYDIRAFQSVLYKTDLFRREMYRGEYVPGMVFHFEGPLMKRMSAEQIWDSVVSLVLPNPDQYKPNRAKLLQRVAEKRATYHSLNGRPLEEVLPRMKQAGKIREAFSEEQKDLNERIGAAYTSGADELAEQLTAELKEKTREVQRRSREIVLVDLKEPVSDSGMMMGASYSDVAESAREFVQSAKPRKAPEHLSKEERKRWEDAERKSFQTFRETARELSRAVDLPSPARTGHFLRVFGQSDREVIENATSNSSVPQSLHLLNGPLSTAVYNSNSVLGRELELLETPEEKLNLIYTALLSREPTDREVSRILHDFEIYGEETYGDLIWALLNSRQFLFIQ